MPAAAGRYTSRVPTLARFYGIVIAMFYREHEPPHFHARYGGRHMTVLIDSLDRMDGSLPRRAENMVFEWARRHQQELRANWQRAQQRVPLEPIQPLD